MKIFYILHSQWVIQTKTSLHVKQRKRKVGILVSGFQLGFDHINATGHFHHEHFISWFRRWPVHIWDMSIQSRKLLSPSVHNKCENRTWGLLVEDLRRFVDFINYWMKNELQIWDNKEFRFKIYRLSFSPHQKNRKFVKGQCKNR